MARLFFLRVVRREQMYFPAHLITCAAPTAHLLTAFYIRLLPANLKFAEPVSAKNLFGKCCQPAAAHSWRTVISSIARFPYHTIESKKTIDLPDTSRFLN